MNYFIFDDSNMKLNKKSMTVSATNTDSNPETEQIDKTGP